MYYKVNVTKIDYSDQTVLVAAKNDEEAKDIAIKLAIEKGEWQPFDPNFKARILSPIYK